MLQLIIPDPLLIQFESFRIVCVRWNSDGTILAVGGQQTDVADGERNTVHFLTCNGEVVSVDEAP